MQLLFESGYYSRAATNQEWLLIFSLVAEGGYYSRAATIRGAASNRANTVYVTGSAKRCTNVQAMIFLYKRCCSKTRNIFYSLKNIFFGA